LVLLCASFAGLATSYGITRVPAANPAARLRLNPLGDLWIQIQRMRKDHLLGWAVVGNTYLWSLAALLQFVIVIYGHDVLKVNETQTSYLQAAVAIGIGTGSLVAGYLSGPKIEYGLVPLGAAGMTVFSFMVSRPDLNLWHARSELALLGFFGGFYAVPLGALIQHRPTPETKGGVIGASNLFSFSGIFLAAGVYYILAQGFGLGARQIYFAGAVMTIFALAYAIFARPDSLLRLWLWFWTHTRYRVTVDGRELLPEGGGVVLFARQIDRHQAHLLIAAMDRPIHFLSIAPDASAVAGKDGPEEAENWEGRNEVPAWMSKGSRISKWLRVIREDPGPGGAEEEAKRSIDAGDIVCVVGSVAPSWDIAGATRLSVDVEERGGGRVLAPVTIRLARAAGT
jgi:acyl-[acyl-carrier-protein]-phospholipid O-acyltransferase/long-chain-fatty-acid--[acyl-carrier-protein] ligase